MGQRLTSTPLLGVCACLSQCSYGRKKTKCLCGAAACRGWIEKDDTMACTLRSGSGLELGLERAVMSGKTWAGFQSGT